MRRLTDDRRAPVQKAKVERVVNVVSVDSPIPTLDEFDIQIQAKNIVYQHVTNNPELQEILNVLNIVQQKGNHVNDNYIFKND